MIRSIPTELKQKLKLVVFRQNATDNRGHTVQRQNLLFNVRVHLATN